MSTHLHIDRAVADLEQRVRDSREPGEAVKASGLLEALRHWYRHAPGDFDATVCERLVVLRQRIQALEVLEDAISEVPSVQLGDDAAQWLDELAAASPWLEDTACAPALKRTERLFRHRARELPTSLTIRRQRVADGAVEVEQQAPPCPRCARAMTLRQGPEDSWFWGCQDFPECWGRRRTTAQQLAELS